MRLTRVLSGRARRRVWLGAEVWEKDGYAVVILVPFSLWWVEMGHACEQEKKGSFPFLLGGCLGREGSKRGQPVALEEFSIGES